MIEKVELGLLRYDEALRKQLEFHQKAASSGQSYCLFVEHPPVVTMGKNSDASDLIATPDWLKNQGIDVVPTTRGGKLTIHEPGQLVVYPIFRVRDLNLGAKGLIELLANATAKTLNQYELPCFPKLDPAGVWLNDSTKIASIGIRIAKRVSYHGIAINLNNTLDTFKTILPCGLQGVKMTSYLSQTGKKLDMKLFKEKLYETILSATTAAS